MTKIFKLFLSISFIFCVFQGNAIPKEINFQDTTVIIRTLEKLQFDVVRFTVKPNEKVKIILMNADEMQHNLLISGQGSRLKVVRAAMQMKLGKEKNFIPDMDDVLWSIRVLNHLEKDSVSFFAPSTPGTYPYICTLPGHGFVMYGAMYVNKSGRMPNIEEDQNIPKSRRE